MVPARKEQLAGGKLLEALKDACAGLVYISETDSEVNPFLLENHAEASMESLLSEHELITKKPCKKETPDDFFDKLTKDREWHGEAERRRTDRYIRLRKALDENLKGLTLIRAGRVRIEVVIAGIDKAGNIAGISTTAVET